jgi:hypothetical protein
MPSSDSRDHILTKLCFAWGHHEDFEFTPKISKSKGNATCKFVLLIMKEITTCLPQE